MVLAVFTFSLFPQDKGQDLVGRLSLPCFSLPCLVGIANVLAEVVFCPGAAASNMYRAKGILCLLTQDLFLPVLQCPSQTPETKLVPSAVSTHRVCRVVRQSGPRFAVSSSQLGTVVSQKKVQCLAHHPYVCVCWVGGMAVTCTMGNTHSPSHTTYRRCTLASALLKQCQIEERLSPFGVRKPSLLLPGLVSARPGECTLMGSVYGYGPGRRILSIEGA